MMLVIKTIFLPTSSSAFQLARNCGKSLAHKIRGPNHHHMIYHRVGGKTAPYHQSTVLNLNRFLFDTNELDPPSTTTTTTSSSCPSVTLSKDDYRTVHAAKILGLLNGDTLRAGIVLDQQQQQQQQQQQETETTSNDHQTSNHQFAGLVTDEATIEWLPEGKIKKAEPTKNGQPPGSLRITLNSLTNSNQSTTSSSSTTTNNLNTDSSLSSSSSSSSSSRVSLILALPRPLGLSRLLPMISQMGVDHLILTTAQKVPKDYFGSHLFRHPEEMRKLLIEGLCQAADVTLPKVTVVKRLKPFLEDELDDLFPIDEWARVIAHPQRKNNDGNVNDSSIGGSSISNGNNELRMRSIKFPPNHTSKKIVIAVGPEGGWAEPYELDLFKEQCHFQQITLGKRILRSDVAVVSLLSLAHDECAD